MLPNTCLQVELKFFHEPKAQGVDFLCFLRRALGPTTGTGKEKRRTLRKSNDAPANYWSIDWSIPFLSYYSFKSKEWRMSVFSQNHQYIIKTKGYENWKHDHQWGNALIVYEKKKNYQLILQGTVWRSVWRIWMWLQGLKDYLKHFSGYVKKLVSFCQKWYVKCKNLKLSHS